MAGIINGQITDPNNPTVDPANPASNTPFQPASSTAAAIGTNTGTSSDPTKVNMTTDMTAQGRLASIMDPNSPLMQQAKTQGLTTAAGRGLLNSSMAVTAGQDAMYRAATPIAVNDANATSHIAESNATNATSQANTAANNATSITNTNATNATSQANTAANNATSITNTNATNATTVQVNAAKDKNAVLLANNSSAAQSLDKLNNIIATIDSDTKMSVADKQNATSHALSLFQTEMDAFKSGGVPDVSGILANIQASADATAKANAEEAARAAAAAKPALSFGQQLQQYNIEQARANRTGNGGH